jgi:LCP family protein required for cell wall assembly
MRLPGRGLPHFRVVDERTLGHMGAESLWEPYTPVRPDSPTTPPPPAPPPPRGRRPRGRRAVAVGCLSPVVLLGAGIAFALVVSERLGDNVARVHNAFGALDESTRPPPTGALTFLLVGTDSRSETTPAGVLLNGTNSEGDVVMVAQVAPDRRSATVVSIPRDTWVDIPDRPANRIATAYSAGGPSLLIRTVEGLTDLRIDHFAVIDFAGFRSMVDAVGGIDVDVPAPVGAFGRGVNHMDGAQALAYVRDPSGYTRGDRARRQQNALRAILTKAASSGTLTGPVQLYDFLDAASRSVGVDDTLSNDGLRAIAIKMSDLGPKDVIFLRAPVAALARDRGQTVVRLDRARAQELWSAVRDGSVDGFMQRNATDALGPTAT